MLKHKTLASMDRRATERRRSRFSCFLRALSVLRRNQDRRIRCRHRPHWRNISTEPSRLLYVCDARNPSPENLCDSDSFGVCNCPRLDEWYKLGEYRVGKPYLGTTGLHRAVLAAATLLERRAIAEVNSHALHCPNFFGACTRRERS